MLDLTFGEQVKIVLSRKGMTIKELAETIEERTGKKMSRQNLTQRLGRDNFQEQDMRMIAEILDCPFHLSILDEEEIDRAADAVQSEEREHQGPVQRFIVAGANHHEELIYSSERDVTIGELADFGKAMKEQDELAELDEDSAEELEEETEIAEESAEESIQQIESEEAEGQAEEEAETEGCEEALAGTDSEADEEKEADSEASADESGEVSDEEAAESAVAKEETDVSTGADQENTDAADLREEADREAAETVSEVQEAEEKQGTAETERRASEEETYAKKKAVTNVFKEYIKKPLLRGYNKAHTEAEAEEEQPTAVKEEPIQTVAPEPTTEIRKPEPKAEARGEINPYTGREYETNSVRMHPKRIGYVQVYDRADHKWTDMTEWAFLGYQERKKAMLGKDYEPPIYLD